MGVQNPRTTAMAAILKQKEIAATTHKKIRWTVFAVTPITRLRRRTMETLPMAHRPYRISHIIYSQGRADNGDPCWVRRILAKLPGCCFITCRTGCCSCSDHRSLCLCKLATERLPTWSAHETLLREPSSDPRFQVFHSVYAESWLPQVGSEAIC